MRRLWWLSLLVIPLQAAPGRFGPALDATRGPLLVAGNRRYVDPPLTVECWARLHTKAAFNLLVASEPKASGTHWELYTYAGSGVLSAYLPGYAPAELRSTVDLADDAWHHVAMQYEAARVRLWADGRQVLDTTVTRQPQPPALAGPLTFGAALAPGQELGCDGLVDDVRISNGVRPVVLPTGPLTVEADTVGLWHLDAADKAGAYADSTPFANPAKPDLDSRVSLDDLDRAAFQPGPSPFDREALSVELRPDHDEPLAPWRPLSLDGPWQLAEGGDEAARLGQTWPDAIAATVPGSIHTALVAAGKLPDPKFGRNDALAHAKSFSTWWYRRRFARPTGSGHRLVFHGVAIRCTAWLNGRLLGRHDGMFGGPSYDLPPDLPAENDLVVRLDPAPGDPKAWNNPAWQQTVAFNCTWGWHYSSIPPAGIWRSVTIESPDSRWWPRLGREGQQTVWIDPPFVATRDAARGELALAVRLHGPAAGFTGRLVGTIAAPDGRSRWRFERPVASDAADRALNLRLTVPQPALWWPNGLGEHPLYRLAVAFRPDGDDAPLVTARETTFGIRTVAMAPLPGGPRSSRYNWTFVVNGKPVFMPGANWCTLDSSMDFGRERYQRFLALARDQHVRMLRAWGSGMPETDDFYDLCDQYGILVLQEWPTAWNSHRVQPFGALEETVRLNTLRLRNHPSLAMYGGGNESSDPTGPAIDMMGRYAAELDGTRPFHRGEPWGGSQHNYNCWWGQAPLDFNLGWTAPFIGEFGLASLPNVESVRRYLPADEPTTWPPAPESALAHHTPVFNTAQDVARLTQYSGYFTPPDSLEHVVWGSQLAQAVGLRHTLERARTRWPDCTGALYYKLNDNYPAASWSTVDWYGVPKLSWFFVQQAFRPLHACLLFDRLAHATPSSCPVWLLDDAARLHGPWAVVVRTYNGALEPLAQQRFDGQGPIGTTRRLGEFELPAAPGRSPLLTVVDLRVAGQRVDRTFYVTDFEADPGCLLRLPCTRLSSSGTGARCRVSNAGSKPAVGLEWSPSDLATDGESRRGEWLDAGESLAAEVARTDLPTVHAWNAEPAAR